MSDKSKIEWTEATWNPIAGCTKCSPGCLNCYAERFAYRLACMGQKKYQKVISTDGGVWNHKIYCDESVLDKPLHWRKPRRIFVCSMSDLFHPKVPFSYTDRVFDIMYKCPQHTFLVLTKRPKQALSFVGEKGEYWFTVPNIHLGVSISNQAEADEKIPILLQIPATVRWLSIEPLLSEIDLSKYIFEECRKIQCRNCGSYKSTGVWGIYMCGECGCGEGEEVDFNCEIDWIVVGCESGPKHRPCNTEWVRSIVEQCKAAGVKIFVKQVNVQGRVIKMPQAFPQELP